MPKRKPKDPDRSPDLPHNWIERHLKKLAEYCYYDPVDLDDWQYKRAELESLASYRFIDEDWKPIRLGDWWGGKDVTAFFCKMVDIPESHAVENTMLDVFLDGGEAQLSVDGYPWQGLDWNRSLVPIGEHVLRKSKIDLKIEAFVINFPYDDRRRDEREFHRFARARLLKVDRNIEAFLSDAYFVLDAYLSYYRRDDNLEIESFLLHHLEETCRRIGPHIESREEAVEAASRAREVLRDKVFGSSAYRHDGRVNICAHSHLDIIYLWPIKETFRKNCRTVTNMLSLMREYPEYKFSNSQAYLYKKLKEMYPEVFEELRARVKEGRWEIIGSMFVEPDGNLLGPESWVRQILFGKRFLREEFGIESETCWLPDVFGLVYTLPQILRKSGVKYFSTVKMNIWNDTNEFPHDTFRWRGPDGSEVLTHFPSTHFGQPYSADNLRQHWKDFREKQTVGENLFVYGYADGGGGPTREMVEASLRSENFPGLPNAEIEFAEEFFRRIETKNEELAVWDDELYLEAHRGTYTSKGDLKRLNRKGELLYRDAEILSAMAHIYGGEATQQRLNEGWELLLLHQFHDTLPGTHRPEGVPDIKRDYEKAFSIGNEVRDAAIDRLMASIDFGAEKECDAVLFNTLSWTRRALASVRERRESMAAVSAGSDTGLPVQHYGGRMWFEVEEAPSMGWVGVRFSGDVTRVQTGRSREEATASFDGRRIETEFYQIEIEDDGTLRRIFDKEFDREVLSGGGNRFQVFEDDPGYKFNSWDIAYHFEEYRYQVELSRGWELASNGPLFAVFSSSWWVLDSTIEQEMWLYKKDRRIDFSTKIQWHNTQKLLKVAFPLAVRSTTATYDLPFGHIERNTHRNTSWDQAKFEVVGHKWADISEGDYGVALLNDCKYGYDAKENVLRLSLLRSPIRPDDGSDQGDHRISYSLYPHYGTWRQAQVDRRGYEYNVPAIMCEVVPAEKDAGRTEEQSRSKAPSSRERKSETKLVSLPPKHSILNVDSSSLIVETVKQAEDGNGVVVRSFDSTGTHSHNIFMMPVDVARIEETDLLEENPVSMDAESRRFSVRYSPYEIKTHRLILSCK